MPANNRSNVLQSGRQTVVPVLSFGQIEVLLAKDVCVCVFQEGERGGDLSRIKASRLPALAV